MSISATTHDGHTFPDHLYPSVTTLRLVTPVDVERFDRLVSRDRRNFRYVLSLLSLGSLLAVTALALGESWTDSNLAIIVGLAMAATAVLLNGHHRRHSTGDPLCFAPQPGR